MLPILLSTIVVFARLLRGEGFHQLRSAAECQVFELSRGQQIFRKGLKRDLQSSALIDFQHWFRSQARNHRNQLASPSGRSRIPR